MIFGALNHRTIYYFVIYYLQFNLNTAIQLFNIVFTIMNQQLPTAKKLTTPSPSRYLSGRAWGRIIVFAVVSFSF